MIFIDKRDTYDYKRYIYTTLVPESSEKGLITSSIISNQRVHDGDFKPCSTYFQQEPICDKYRKGDEDMKKSFLILLLVFFIPMLSGCHGTVSIDEEPIKCPGMTNIEGMTNLYYMNDTCVVYIIMYGYTGAGNSRAGHGYMSPYISKNGKFCIYEDEELKEIE